MVGHMLRVLRSDTLARLSLKLLNERPQDVGRNHRLSLVIGALRPAGVRLPCRNGMEYDRRKSQRETQNHLKRPSHFDSSVYSSRETDQRGKAAAWSPGIKRRAFR